MEKSNHSMDITVSRLISWKPLTIIIISLFLGSSIFAQVLIPSIPGSNQYPITFTSAGQNQLVLRFDSQISATPTSWLLTGWSISGTIATITGVVSNLDLIQITLSGAITYAERENILLSYDGSGNTPIAIFNNVPAVNNYLISCGDLSISTINLDNNSIACQQVEITVTGNIVVPAVARNSIYFNETNGVRINFVWLLVPLINQTIDYTGSETFAGSGIFTVNKTYTYGYISDCQISPYLYIMHYWNSGDYMDTSDPEGDHRLRCNDAAYIIQEKFPTFCTDNLYSGVLALNEPVEGREYCIGEDIPGVQFINGTLLNCRMTAPAPYGPLTAEEANRSTRWVRFVYGTHTGAGIPNVFVDIGGVMTQVTDASGIGLNIIGEVQEYASPQDAAQGLSEEIYHTGSFATDEVDDVFGVTMQMWNQCNHYELDIFGFPVNAPVEIYNDLIIVSGPIADAGADFTICEGSTTGPLDGHIFLAADRGEWSSATGGSFNNFNNLNATYTPSAADILAGGVTLTLTAIDDGALTCPEHEDEVYITILPAIVNNSVSAAQSICQGETPDPLTGLVPTGGNGTYAYLWEYSITSAIAGFSTAPAPNTDPGYSPGALTQTTWYRRRVTSGVCSNTSTAVGITVNPIPSGTNTTTSAVCSGTSLNINPQTQGSVTVPGCSFTWTGNNGSSGTGNITDTPTNVTSARINVIYTVIPTGPASTNCVGSSFTVTVPVDPNPVAGTLSAVDASVCDGENIQFSLTGYKSSSVRLRIDPQGATPEDWAKSAETPSGDPYTITFLSSSGTYPDPGTHSFRLWVDFGACNAVYTNYVSVVVAPLTVGGSVDPDRSLCQGSTSGLLTLSGHTGSVTRWQVSTNDGGSWTDIANTNTTYTSGALTPETYWYRAEVKSGDCSAQFSDYAIITVSPTSNGGTLSGGSTPICQGSSTGTMTVASYTGTITRWEKRVDGGGWSNIANTNTTYSETPSSAGTWDYRVLVTSGACAGAYSNNVTIVVDPTTVGGSVSGGSTPICLGSGTGAMTLSGHTGAVLRWQKRVNAGGWTDIANITTTYSETPSSTGTWEYRAEVKSGSCSALFSTARTIIVDPASAGGSVSGGSTPICYGINTGVMTLSGHTGTVQKWQKRVDGGGWTDIANTLTTYSEIPSASGTWDYRAEVKSGSCPATYSTERTIIVRPRFQVAQLHDDQSICNNTSTNFYVTLTGGTSPYTVNYTRDATPLSTGAGYISGSNISTGILTTGTYVYTITSVTDAVGCPVESTGTPITITVGAALTGATLTGSGDACYGAASTLRSVITGGAPPYTLTITGFAGSPVGGYTSGSDIALTPPALTVGPHTYTLASVTDACTNTINPGANYTINISAIPDISGTLPLTQTRCNNTSMNIALDTDVPGTVYTWTVDDGGGVTWVSAPAGGTITDGVGVQEIDQLLEHSETSPVTVTYTITPTGPATTNCVGTPVTRDVVVEPTPAAAISNSTQTLCDGAALTAMSVTNSRTHTLAATFDMAIVATTGSLLNLTATGNALTTVAGGAYPYNINGTLTNNTDSRIIIEYRVTPKLAGCSNGSNVVATVTIEPTPKAAISNSTQTLCDGAALTAMSVTNSCTHTLAATFDMAIVATTGSLLNLTATGNALTTVAGWAYPYNINGTLTNNTDSRIIIEYRVTPKLAGCSNGSNVVATVTIEPTPKAAISNSTQTLCDGAALTAMSVTNSCTHTLAATFDMAIVATTGSLLNLTATGNALTTVAGGAYPYNINGTLTNNTDSRIIIEYRVTPKLAGCGNGTNVVATVTIEPTPKAAISNSTQTLCDGAALTAMSVTNSCTHTLAATFDMAIVATTGSLLNLTATGNALTTVAGGAYPYSINGTLTNNTDSRIIIEYRVTPKLAGCSNGSNVVATVTIEPTPKAAISNSTQTLCDGAALTAMSVTNSCTHTLAATFDMAIVATTGSLLNLTATGNALTTVAGGAYPYNINGTLTNNTDSRIIIEYRVTPKLTGCSNGSNVVATVTIEPTPKAAISNSTQTLCNGAALTAMSVTNSCTHTLAATFDMTIVATTGSLLNLTATGTALTTVTGGAYPYSINGTLTNSTDNAIVIEYRVTPKLAGCSNGSNVVATVTIEPELKASRVVNTPVICSGDNISIDISSISSPAGTLRFDYTVNSSNPGATGGTAYTGGTNISFPYEITGTLTNSSTAVVTVTYTITPEAGACTGTPVTAVVTVNPRPVINPNSETICSNSIPTITITANIALTTFTWEVVGITGGVTGTLVGNTGTGATFSETLRNLGAADGTVTYRFTPTAPPGVGGCTGSDEDIVITVHPEPILANLDKSICSGSVSGITLSATNIPADRFEIVDIRWDPLLTPGGSNATTGPNQLANAIFNDVFTNVTTSVLYVEYDIIPRLNSTGCTGDMSTVTLSVGSEPVLNPGLDKFACNDELIGLVLSGDGISIAPSFYNIISVTIDPDLDADAGNATIPEANAADDYLENDLYTNNTTSDQTVIYRVQPVLAPDCFGDPVDVVITIHPPLVGGSIFGGGAICYNTNAPVITNTVIASGGDGTLIYSWYKSEVVGATLPLGGDWSLIPGATDEFYDPDILITETRYIRVAVDGFCSAEVYSNIVTFTIKPLPVTTDFDGDTPICDDATNKIYQVASHANTTYHWTVPGTYLDLTFDMNLYFIIVDAIPGSSGTETIEVYETNNTTGCTGLPITYNVTVSPVLPGEDIDGNAAVCQADTVRFAVENRDGTEGSDYDWDVPAGATIISGHGTYEIYVSFTMVIAPATIRAVETTSNGCTTIHNPLSITINPLPAVYNLTAPVAYCATESGVTITLSNSQTDVNYQLYKDAAPDGAPLAGSNGSALTWTDKTAASYYVVATHATTGCSQQMNGTVTPTINIIMAGTIGSDQTICEGTSPFPFTNIAGATGGGSLTYQWQSSDDNVTFTSIVGATSAIYTSGPLSDDTYFKRIAYSTMGTSVCSDESNTILVDVNTFDPGSIETAQTICEGDDAAELTTSAGDPITGEAGTTWGYQWMSSNDGVNFNIIIGATSETYTPLALTEDTWYKRSVTATYNAKACTEETNSVKITVINFTPGTIGGDQTICENTIPTTFTSVAASGDGTKVYQWEYSTDHLAWADAPGASTGATYTPPAGLTQETWFRREVTVTVAPTSCVGYTNEILVTVNNMIPGVILDDQTICESDIPAGLTSDTDASSTDAGAVITYQWQSSTDNVTYYNITSANNNIYAPGALTADTYFRRGATSTLNGNQCTEYTTEVLITVINFTPGSIGAAQTVCEGIAPAGLTTTAAPSGDGGFTLLWQESADGTTFTDIAPAETGNSYNPPALAQDTWYRIAVTSTVGAKTCTEYTNSVKITVNNLDPGSIGGNQEICESTSATTLTSSTPVGDGTITYTWYVSSDGLSFAPAGVTTETLNPGVLIADRWYYRDVTSTVGGHACTESTNTVTVTVNNFDPGSIKTAQAICEGDDPALLESDVVPATYDVGAVLSYQWKDSPDGVTFTDIALNGDTEDYDPPALTQDTWYKRAVTSTLGGSICTEETNAIKITVINFAPGAIGGDQTICESTIPTTFTSVAASGDGTKVYQWEYSTDHLAWADAPGASTGATYTPPAGLTQETWFRREVTVTVAPTSCVGYTNEILVTVNNMIPGVILDDQTICESAIPAGLTSDTDASSTDAGAVITYQWQSSTDNVTYYNIASANNNIYAPGALTADTYYRRGATSTLNGNQCTEYTTEVLITVINFAPGSIGAAQTVCEGTAPAGLTTTAGPSGDGGFTLLWQESLDGTAFSDIAPAETGNSYNPPALAQDTWYRIAVTSTVGANTCTEYTNSVKITVNNLDPGSIGGNQEICESTSATTLTSATPVGDGTITYTWYISSDGLSFAPAGVTTETLNPGVLIADRWYYRDVTSTLGGHACTESTNTVTVTVNNFDPGSIKTAQAICEGDDPALLESDVIPATYDVGAVLSYQWKESPDGVTFSDIALNGDTEDYDPPAGLTQDTWYKRAVTSTLGASICTEETNAIKVTVINFAPGSINTDQTICENTIPATFNSGAPSGDGVFTYQWEYSTDNVNWFNAPGVSTGATYTAPAALLVDTWYRRIVTATLGGTSCPEITNSVKVTINVLTPGISTADQTICEGEVPLTFASTPPAGSGVLTYQWQKSIDNVNYSNITGATSDTYTSVALTVDTWFKLAVTSTLNGNVCTETTNAVAVTVNNFSPGSISSAQTICYNTVPLAFTSVAPSGDGATYDFEWLQTTDNIIWSVIGGETSDTYAPGALTQDTWFKRKVTSWLNGIPCEKETDSVKITVINFNPGSIAASQIICEGSVPVPLTSVTPTGDGSFTYQWYESSNGTLFTSILGAIYETYSPLSLTADKWYRREVLSTLLGKTCTDTTARIKITVNNFNPGSISGDVTICEGETPAPLGSVLPSGDGTSYAYQWKSSTDGVNFLNITGANSDTYAPGALTQDTWYKRAVTSTLGANTCTEETNAVEITVNNVNAGTIVSNQTICLGSDPVTFYNVVFGTGDGTLTYQWQSSIDGTTYTDISGADAANYDPPVLSADTWYKRITKSLLNAVECTDESNVVKITINVVTGGTVAADQTICFGDTPAPFTSSDDGSGTGTVSYQWLRSDNNTYFSTIAGATSTTYAPGIHYTDAYYVRRILSNLGGTMCTAESDTLKITINPLPIAVLTGGETICPGESSILNVEMMVGTGPFELDIDNLGIVTGYVSNADITVTPVSTTTYKLLRVTDANGCEIVSPNASLIGTAVVTVRALPAITTSPVSKIICEFNATTFTVAASGSDLTYQWYVDEGSGFSAITDGGVYYGATNTTLNIFGATRTMSGYVYHAVATTCATDATSNDATLTVNTPPEIQLHPADSSICVSLNASFAVTATGTNLVYQWQVNKGAGFVSVVNDANFSGAAAATLNITNAPAAFNNYIFRVIITGTCGAPVYSNFAVLRVYAAPAVNLHPANKTLCDGGGPITFVSTGTGLIDSLRWQVYSGGVWSDIQDGVVYSGTFSQQLTLSNVPLALNGNQYRLGFKAKCTTVYSNAATLTVNSNPVVDFSALDPLAACGNVPIVIDGNPSGGSGTYSSHLWTGDVGPLNNYFIQSPTFMSQIASTFVLNYKVTDSNGCYDSDDLTVNVDAPSADFTQDVMNGCTPVTVNFTKDMGTLAKFWWDFDDGSAIDSVTASPTHIFTNNNPASIEYFNVKLRVKSAGGCYDEFISSVTIYPAIDAAFTASTIIVCSGESITFTSAPGASKYFWEFGDLASGYSPTESTKHLYTNFTTAPLTLTVKLTTTSFYNCTDESTMTITVMPVPIPQFEAVPPTQIYNTSGNPVTFTNTTNSGTWTYLWRFDDGATATDQNPVHTYTALGTYDVTLVVSNTSCSDSVMHQVMVLPPPPVADFDSIPSGCEPVTVTFNNTSTDTDVPGTSFRWDFGDGSYSTTENPDYTWFDEGSYRVELTVTGPGGTSTKSQIVHVYPSPRAYFEVSPKVVFVNDEMVRCFNHSEDADSYLWDFGDGDTSKLEEPFHKYMDEGIYDITLWAYSENGCADMFTLSPAVTVEPAGELRFATVFQPNLDGPVDIDHIPEGGEEVDQFFYPPIREKVIKYKLQVFNRLGVLIFDSHDINQPWNGYYKGKLCPQGVYVWYVEGKYANGEPFKKVGNVTLLH